MTPSQGPVTDRPLLHHRATSRLPQSPGNHRSRLASWLTPDDTSRRRCRRQRSRARRVSIIDADFIRSLKAGQGPENGKAASPEGLPATLDAPTVRKSAGRAPVVRVDLDPGPGVSWTDVRAVALEVKSLLDEMGLRGWPKTSF
jgi:hypothetical protein